LLPALKKNQRTPRIWTGPKFADFSANSVETGLNSDPAECAELQQIPSKFETLLASRMSDQS
jgi:hypothetical protein